MEIDKILRIFTLLSAFSSLCYGQTLPPGATVVNCGEYDIIDPGGDVTISSPNYPNNYENSMHCLWVIQCTKAGSPITIKFTYFNVIASPDCKDDSVLLRDGLRTNSTVLGHLCGTSVRKLFVSKGNYVRMEFNTNANLTAKGFALVAHCILNETTPTTATPPTTAVGGLLPGSTVISCGEYDIIDPGGSIDITSTNYPNNYNNSERCRYAIVCTNTKYRLKFEFLDFKIQPSPKCDKDVLFMRDGLRSNSTLMLHGCGPNPPKRVYYSTQGEIRVEFDTDATITDKGFKARISCLIPPTTSTTPTMSTTTPPWTALKVCRGSTVVAWFSSMVGIFICFIHRTIFSYALCD